MNGAELLEDMEVCGNRLQWIREMIITGHETLDASKDQLTDVILDLAVIVAAIRDQPKDDRA